MTIPHITQAHLDKVYDHPSDAKSLLGLINKAIQIALAEANAQQETYITADEARKLGAGKAEWLGVDGIWRLQDGIMNPMYSVNLKYRAIQSQAINQSLCGYAQSANINNAQPEPSDPHAALRAEYANQVAEGAVGFYLWEFSYGNRGWEPVGLNIPIFDKQHEYRCTDISCYVSKDGEPAIRMLRTEAQKLQRKTKDTHDWFDATGLKSVDYIFRFDVIGTYTYRTKATNKKTIWIGSREDVIALLKAFGLLKE